MAWKRGMKSRAVDGLYAASTCIIDTLLGARLRPSGILAGCQTERNMILAAHSSETTSSLDLLPSPLLLLGNCSGI
jgi:hypothetical protein